MEQQISIKVNSVGKVYNLYEKSIDRLKEVVSLSRRNYHKEYNALKDVSFEVKRGETFGIIGTNGAGKSTLLKLITGVAKPTSGSIEIDGKVSALLELGAGFNVEYTGLENIYLNGTMMGYKKGDIEERVNQIIEFADIGDFIYQPVKNYSSGMFARLAFAVAINVEPDILIVDEALSVGDVFFQNKCYRKFEELRQKGTTVLFVSHDMISIKQLCSRVLWLEKGSVKRVGDTKEICDEYFLSQMSKENEMNSDILKMKQIEMLDPKEVFELYVPDRLPRVANLTDGFFSEDAEILSVYVTDENGVIIEEVEPNNECIVHIVSRFNKDMDGVILGFNIDNIKGIRIIGQNTYALRKRAFSVKKDEVMAIGFKFIFPSIETGNYLISPAIAIGTQESPVILTWINSALQLRVERKGYNLSLVSIPCEFSTKLIKKEF